MTADILNPGPLRSAAVGKESEQTRLDGQTLIEGTYCHFYGLRKRPFLPTPDPEFLWLSASQQQALATLQNGVAAQAGFVILTGQPGVGKTTVIRVFLERADYLSLKVIPIFAADLSLAELLQRLSEELGVENPTADLAVMLTHVQQALTRESHLGRTVLLVVDQAHDLPGETLRGLALLTHTEGATTNRLQLVLVGHAELLHRLQVLEALCQLEQANHLDVGTRQILEIVLWSQPSLIDKLGLPHRLHQSPFPTAQVSLAPLTAKESQTYIRHRLAQAGCHPHEVLTPKTLRRIIKWASGIPRVLNALCDQVLTAGYQRRQKPIHVTVVADVLTAQSVGRDKARIVPSTLPVPGIAAALSSPARR